MMKDILIKIDNDTRTVNLSKSVIGNDAENMQGKLIFSFENGFINGQARLEYMINSDKNYIVLNKVDDTYQVPIKSILTKNGRIFMQLVVTEGTNEEEIPIFKSNVFYVWCNRSINAEIEQPSEYPSWIDVANTKLNEIDNLDISAVKEGNKATITITKKDGSKETVELFDGTGGGGTGTSDYNNLYNKPLINGIKLEGNKSLEDLNIKQDYTANDIKFSDGETFQDKYNNGELKGEQGNNGSNGKDAKINGVNTLNIVEGANINLQQQGDTLTISSSSSVSGGTSNYSDLLNKPKINGIELTGDKTSEELGISSSGGNNTYNDWKYLGNIKTNEDTSSLIMTKDSNGNPLNLKAVLFEGRISTSATSGDIYASTSNGESRNPFCNDTASLNYGLSYRFIYKIFDGYGKWILEQSGTDEQVSPIDKVNLQADIPKFKSPVDFRYNTVSNITSVGIKTKDGTTAIGNGTNLAVWGIKA